MAVCIYHPRTDELTRLQPHHNCIAVPFLAEDSDCVATSRGKGSQVSYFAGGGGYDTEMVATDSEDAGSGSVDEGADDDQVCAGAKGELGRHGEEVGDGGDDNVIGGGRVTKLIYKTIWPF